MILYLSSLATLYRGPRKEENLRVVLDEMPLARDLCTYYDKREFSILREFGFRNMMLDSGAYSAFTKGIEIDIDDLIEFNKKYAKYIAVPVALDVIGDGEASYKNRRYMVDAGINALPIYHYGEDWSILDKYVSETDYIGIGGLAAYKMGFNDIQKFFERIFSSYPNHKFHIFGTTAYRNISRFPVYSVDATTWLSYQRFRRFSIDDNHYGVSDLSANDPVFDLIEARYGIERNKILNDTLHYSEGNLMAIRELYNRYVMSNNDSSGFSFNSSLF